MQYNTWCLPCSLFRIFLSFLDIALPNPEEFPDLKSKAMPDVNGYVGFQNFTLKVKDDLAVARQNNSVHILKLVF